MTALTDCRGLLWHKPEESKKRKSSIFGAFRKKEDSWSHFNVELQGKKILVSNKDGKGKTSKSYDLLGAAVTCVEDKENEQKFAFEIRNFKWGRIFLAVDDPQTREDWVHRIKDISSCRFHPNVDGYAAFMNIDPLASPGEIRKAFHQMSKTHHPDRGGEKSIYQHLEAANTAMQEHSKTLYDYNGKKKVTLQISQHHFEITKTEHGLGMSVTLSPGGIIKVRAIENQDLIAQGLRVGDRLISIGGDNVQKKSFTEVMEMCGSLQLFQGTVWQFERSTLTIADNGNEEVTAQSDHRQWSCATCFPFGGGK